LICKKSKTRRKQVKQKEFKEKIVFKRCGNYLVYLEKLKDSKTNENRESLKEKTKEEKIQSFIFKSNQNWTFMGD